MGNLVDRNSGRYLPVETLTRGVHFVKKVGAIRKEITKSWGLVWRLKNTPKSYVVARFDSQMHFVGMRKCDDFANNQFPRSFFFCNVNSSGVKIP
jgi:hypothetical protein